MSKQELLPADGIDQSIARVHSTLTAQHAIHGVLADVLIEVGGKNYIKDWAEENPGAFIRLLVSSVPNLAPVTGISGDVSITINNTLIRTELDA
jgi:hypothetical protein